jgi:ADP-ribose pyrophosphatase YjhB (NUDIX family)
MSDVIHTGHALVFQESEVLLVRHGEKADHLTGVYGIPGGRPNEGESILTAAVRELLEETGVRSLEKDLYEFPNNKYTADIKRKDGTIKRFTMTVFLCTDFAGEIKSSLETIPEWVKITDLDNYNLLPNVRNAVLAGAEFLKNEKTKN